MIITMDIIIVYTIMQVIVGRLLSLIKRPALVFTVNITTPNTLYNL